MCTGRGYPSTRILPLLCQRVHNFNDFTNVHPSALLIPISAIGTDDGHPIHLLGPPSIGAMQSWPASKRAPDSSFRKFNRRRLLRSVANAVTLFPGSKLRDRSRKNIVAGASSRSACNCVLQIPDPRRRRDGTFIGEESHSGHARPICHFREGFAILLRSCSRTEFAN